jgi:hypothetical protein
MKTFFSILNIKTNSFSNEKIAIGLIAVTANQVYYAYSKNKLALLDKLSPSNKKASFVKSILKQYENTVDSSNESFLDSQKKLEHNINVFSFEYFDYLNKYNNGLIQFTEPVVINKELSQSDFSSYYFKFIGENQEVNQPQETKSFYKKVKPLLHKQNIELKADINFTFNPVSFKGILKEVQLPLITKNGSISALQIVDFTHKPNTIANHFYETKIILNALHTFANDIKCDVDKIKIGFEEPKLNTEQHKMFDMAYNEYKDAFDFSTIDAVDAYTDQVASSNNITFSSLLKK